MNTGLMKYILVGAVLLAVVGTAAYSAGMSSTVRRLGGTGGMSVAAPTSATASATWQTFNTSGSATVSRVTWTPTVSGNYTVSVYVLNGAGTVIASGSASVVGSGTSQRNDDVTLGTPAAIASVASVKVRIAQN
jgi:hypothetical protein